MRDEPFALSTRPPAPSAETDYDAICAAVTATARGRWFLDEFARRNRNTDTTQVLDAIARMQAAVSSDRAEQSAQQANQEVRIELLEMARTIALTRAEVAEHQSETARAAAAEPAGAASPEIAAAAERLLQIAWTMRACGVELAASDQIGHVAQAILSADTLRNLDDHRAHRLTEALHHLEQRIDRMLDGHRPGSSDALGETQPQAALHGRQAEQESTAPHAAAIGAAIFAAAAAVEAETEPASVPANDDIPSSAAVDAVPPPPEPETLAAVPALDQDTAQDQEAPEGAQAQPTELEPAEATASTGAAPDESAQAFALGEPPAPALAEPARATLPAQAEPAAIEESGHAPIVDQAANDSAPSVTLGATEYPMDDDVVLSVADDVADVEHAPLPSLELGPGTIATPLQAAPLPTTDMAPLSFAAPAPDAAAVAAHAELEPASTLPLTHDLPAFRSEHAELAGEPSVVADNIIAQTVFAGLDLEPLVVAPEPATEARSPARPAGPEADVPAASITIDDVLNRQAVAAPATFDRPTAHAASVPIPETDLSADDDLLVTSATAAITLPEQLAFESVEHAAQVATHAGEPANKPQPIALELDPIAVQVDHDLDSLTDIVPNDLVPGAGVRADAAAAPAPTAHAASTIQDDPADFLLEALPAPISVARDVVPPPAARWQPPSAEFTTALAAIEIELRAGAAVAGAEAQASGTRGADAAAESASSTADSTLAALMAMSEEERIALFS
jgi:hypothetical protein